MLLKCDLTTVATFGDHKRNVRGSKGNYKNAKLQNSQRERERDERVGNSTYIVHMVYGGRERLTICDTSNNKQQCTM